MEFDLDLKHYKMNKGSPIGCNYIGKLRGDSSSSVAVTGCLNKPEDRLQVTMLSKQKANGMFFVDSFGNAEGVRSPFQDGAKSGMMSRSEGRKEEKAWRLEGWHSQEGDEEINDELEQFVASVTTTSEVPSKLTTTLQFGYDDGMLASLEDMDEDGDIDGDDFTAYIQTVMTHVQSYYSHSESLGTEIEIQVLDGSIYKAGENWNAGDNLNEATDASLEAFADGYVADAFSWWCADGGDNTAGYAWVGLICDDPYDTNIEEMQTNELRSAYLLAHELGHNLGMYHDFADRHGGEGNPCDDTGIMSYGSYSWWETISQWSTCSASDFASHYDAYNWGKWCLDDISEDESTTDSATTDSATTSDDSSVTPQGDCPYDVCAYYVDDGCHSEGSTPDDIAGFYQSETSTSFVRCCSDDATSCSTISNCRDTSDLVTYAEAATKCATNGQRLCTKDELLSDVCCGTGGQCDSEGVWTSTWEDSAVSTSTDSAVTTSEPDTGEEIEYYVDDGCHSEGSNPDDVVGFFQPESSTAFIRCCTTDGTGCSPESRCNNSDDLVTYADAEATCVVNGGRLCTKDELLTGICCGTGGQCDSYGVWTSTTSTD